MIWVSLLGAGIRRWAAGNITHDKISWLPKLIGILAAAQALVWMKECWPKQKEMEWVILILLTLAVLQAAKGEQETIYGGLILWWFTAFLLGSVLISAAAEVKIDQWQGQNKGSHLEKNVLLLSLLLLPCFIEKKKTRGKAELGLFLVPVLCAVSVQGVLSPQLWEESKAPFYDVSRSIRLYGMLERMEAIAWLGLMLGTYLYLSFLMTIAGKGEETTRHRKSALLLSAGAAKTAEIILREDILMEAVLTGIIAFGLLSICIKEAEKRREEKCKNLKKPVDK